MTLVHEAATTTATALDALHGPLPEALSRADFTNLVVLLRHARQGAWAFALYNNVATRETVVRALKTLLAPLPVYEWTYSPETPYPLTYLDRLAEAQRRERAVVFFFDFERAGDAVWKSLDYNRELYADQPHGLVFWISPTVRGVAARKAPHFWAQRSGVFDFRVAQTPALPSDWTTSRDITIENVDEIQRQLRLYQGLLDELALLPTTAPAYLGNLHYKIARLSYYLDRLPESKNHANAALTYAEMSNDQVAIADTMKALGDLALREANLAQARQHYEAALAIYPAIGDRLGEANVQKALGDLALREANLAQARQRYSAALAIYPAIGDRLGEANVLQALGDLEMHEANLVQARQRYSAALAIYSTIGARLGEANVLQALGDLEMHEANLMQARRHYKAALAIYPAIGARLGEANVLQALGDLEMREDNLVEARRHYEAALAIYPAIGDRLGEANVLQSLGDLEIREANLAQARERYEAALHIYPAIGDRLGEANMQKALGDLALREANLAQARQHYEAALRIYPTIGDRLGEANLRNRLGNLYSAEENWEAAWTQFHLALKLHTAIDSQLGIAASFGYMGRTAYATDNHAQAVLLFDEALAIYREIADRFSQMLCLTDQGTALQHLTLSEAALGAWWQALTLAQAINDSTAQRLISFFSQLTEQMGDDEWRQMEADLAAHAEEWRQVGVATVRAQADAQP